MQLVIFVGQQDVVRDALCIAQLNQLIVAG
jgi:hypothetical protein